MDSKPVSYTNRILALLLMLGGVFGVGMFLWLAYKSEMKSWPLVALIALGIAIFVWSTIVGIRLWHGNEGARTWAKILYALQVPVLTVNGFEYEYFTGFATPLLHGPGGTHLALSFGASMSLAFNTNSGSGSYVFGVNLIAVVALVVLFRRGRPNSTFKADVAKATQP